MLKAIKVRLYLNENQIEYVGKLMGSYRKVYNQCLEQKINAYKDDKKSLGLSELGRFFHNELTKSEETQYLNEHNTKVLKQAIINLLDAYKNFFKSGKGFPKYKSKHDRQSVRFPLESISKTNNYLDSKLTLTKQLRNIKFECSDRDKKYLNKYKDSIKSATLSKTKTNKYFLSILIDNHIQPTPKPTNDFIGIDMGIKNLMVCSNGQTFNNLNIRKINEKQLVRLQRQLSKKVIGSKNREKSRLKLARKNEKLNNIKLNYIHTITSQLVSENQTIIVEDLNVKGMLKNHCLSRSIQELSIHEVFRQLKYKCEWYGRNFIVIDRYFPSSKLCSKCGFKYKNLTLSERSWVCPECGETHDRDFNAATNIYNEGKRIVGQRLPEITPVDYPTADDPTLNGALKSNGRKKQEEFI